MKINPLELARHREFGDFLKNFREKLLQWLPPIRSHDPKNSKAVSALSSALKTVTALKCEMDNAVCREHPELEDRDVTGIYYGSSKEWAANQANFVSVLLESGELSAVLDWHDGMLKHLKCLKFSGRNKAGLTTEDMALKHQRRIRELKGILESTWPK